MALLAQRVVLLNVVLVEIQVNFVCVLALNVNVFCVSVRYIGYCLLFPPLVVHLRFNIANVYNSVIACTLQEALKYEGT